MRAIQHALRTRSLPGIAACGMLLVIPPAGSAQDTGAELDRYMSDLHDAGEFNGAVSVTLGGVVLLSRGYGIADFEHDVPVSPSTKFRIGSITKQFTAMAIMILRDRGVLDVSDHLAQCVTGIPNHWAGLTIHQLLTHTSGIMHSWALPGFAESSTVPATLDEALARFHTEPAAATSIPLSWISRAGDMH